MQGLLFAALSSLNFIRTQKTVIRKAVNWYQCGERTGRETGGWQDSILCINFQFQVVNREKNLLFANKIANWPLVSL